MFRKEGNRHTQAIPHCRRFSLRTIAPGTGFERRRNLIDGATPSRLQNCLTKASLTGTARFPKEPCLLTRYFPVSPLAGPKPLELILQLRILFFPLHNGDDCGANGKKRSPHRMTAIAQGGASKRHKDQRPSQPVFQPMARRRRFELPSF